LDSDSSVMTIDRAEPHKFKLEAFEGPLDLLLHLVRVNEIDIVDIPIAQITDQFLAYLDMMREIDIDVGGEFMVMAATLIYIKSRMLLPQHDEEADELRDELVERLLEHEQYRAAAAALADREENELLLWRRPAGTARQYFDGEEEVLIEADLFDLITAFQKVLLSLGADASIQVGTRQYAVEEKMAELEKLLKEKKRIYFTELASRYRIKRELIAFFLAILELIRRRRLRAMQAEVFGEIILVKPEKKRPSPSQKSSPDLGI
jgi:segregation and condensation protein A